MKASTTYEEKHANTTRGEISFMLLLFEEKKLTFTLCK